MAAGYTVTAVNQSQELDSGGRLTNVVTVTFELDNGAGSGSVSVPLADGWDTAAEAAVQAKADAMIRLLGL